MSTLDLDIRLARAGFTLAIRRSLPLAGLTAIIGPSGAGKTTLLRAIAGFERVEGRIRFGDEIWAEGRRFVPPHRRRVAMVFQRPSLFTHLDVAGNLAYAARRAGETAALPAMAARFGLTALLSRPVAALSGGEAQRVALARALLTRPRLLLLDEPLTALDRQSRDEVLPHLEMLRDAAGLPTLYVSHVPAEVARLATHVMTLAGGAIAGFGPVADLLPEASELLGTERGSVIAARVAGATADGLTELAFAGGTILTAEPTGLPPGGELRLFVRARDVVLARTRPERLSALNILAAEVRSLSPSGAHSAEAVLDCGGAVLRAELTQRSVAALALAPGVRCHAVVKSVALLRG